MTGTNTLERAWESAQERLAQIQYSLGSSTSPGQRIIRVGQLDAELLDLELAQVLQEPIVKALSLVNSIVKVRIEPELGLLIRLLLYKLSVWDTGGSYGAKLQDLRYVITPSPSRSLAPSGLPRKTLLLHGLLTIFLPYLHSRLRAHALSHAWPDAPSSGHRRKAWGILTSTESLHGLFGLVNFVAFLWNGRYRTLADRLLRLRLVHSREQVRRDVSYEFMNRQMVWHVFTEFLLFLLPLLHTRSVRRRTHKLLSYLHPLNVLSLVPTPVTRRLGLMGTLKTSKSAARRRGKFWSLPADQCAICAENASFSLNISEPTNIFTTLAPLTTAEDHQLEPPAHPIYIPYIASCGDIYCYGCIAERLMRTADDLDKESGWECLRCCEEIASADRYGIDVPEAESESDYTFSSGTDLEAMDMSGSMGS